MSDIGGPLKDYLKFMAGCAAVFAVIVMAAVFFAGVMVGRG